MIGLGVGLWGGVSAGGGGNDFRAAMPAGATYTRTGGATGLTSTGLIQSFAADVPQRTDRGLLLESASTNVVDYSQDFDNAAWIPTGATVTGNLTVAPDGTTTADRIELPAGSNYLTNTTDALLTTGQPCTFSVFMRARGSAQTIGLRSGVSGLSSAIALTTSWQRVSWTVNAAATSEAFQIANGSLVGGASAVIDVDAWGAQIEMGSLASSYIPTAVAAVVRGLPVFTEPVPVATTRALLTYADNSTTLVTGLTPGGTFDVTTAVNGAGKGKYAASELVTRSWVA